jgi:outer membrane protein
MTSMPLKHIALVACIALSALGVSADAQALKIGYVDSQRVLSEAEQGKAAQAKLQAEFGQRESDLQQAGAKLAADAAALDRDAPTLSEADRNRRQRDLADQDRDLQRKRAAWEEDLKQRRAEEISALVERANRVIKQIYETEKYDLIVQDAVHAGPQVDISKKVIDLLNAQK